MRVSLLWLCLVPLFLSSCGGNESGTATSPSKFLASIDSSTAAFPGRRGEYSLTLTPGAYKVTDSSGRVTQLDAAVQRIRFADVTLNLNIGAKATSIAAADLKTLTELYIAFFNRVPDADGLAYWIDQFKAGKSIEQIAQSFYAAALQYSSLTGYTENASDADFVRLIYKNVLGRSGTTAPPDADVQYWAGELASGRASKGSLVRTMLNAAHAYQGDATWGWVANLLNNKYSVARYFAITQQLNYNSAEETILNTMQIAAAVTPTSSTAAFAQVQTIDGTAVLPNVTTTLTSPASITQQVLPDYYVSDVTLKGTASGNLSALSGKPVYVLVEDPDGLFEPSAYALIGTTGVTVTLRGKRQTVSGKYTGNLGVFVCLDLQCKTRLDGSPFLVPYDVSVLGGATTTVPTPLSITTTFGKVPASVTLPVNIPKEASSWRAEVSTPYNPYVSRSVYVSTSTDSGGATGKLTISFVPLLPGTFQEKIALITQVRTTDGRTTGIKKEFDLSYTIKPDSSVNYVFEPNPLVIERKYKDISSRPSPYWIVPNTGLEATWRGVEYLSAPAAAANHRQVAAWWYPYSSDTVPCYSTIVAGGATVSDCMPVGSYTARIHYTISRSGVALEEVYLPVTMNIVP